MSKFKLSPANSYIIPQFIKIFSLKKLLILLLLIIVIAINNKLHFTKVIQSKLTDIVAPIVFNLKISIQKILSIKHDMDNYLSLEKQNILFKQENALLKYQQSLFKQYELENKQLKRMLNFVGDSNFSFITTQVAGDLIGPYIHSVIILAGENAGIKNGQPVVNNEGLVGRVIEVNKKSARVLLITDFNSKIPAITQNSRQRAIVAGYNSAELKALYLADEAKLKMKELLVTTGDGDYFPPGLPIGYIDAVKDKDISVKPVVKIGELDYVSVISYEKDK